MARLAAFPTTISIRSFRATVSDWVPAVKRRRNEWRDMRCDCSSIPCSRWTAHRGSFGSPSLDVCRRSFRSSPSLPNRRSCLRDCSKRTQWTSLHRRIKYWTNRRRNRRHRSMMMMDASWCIEWLGEWTTIHQKLCRRHNDCRNSRRPRCKTDSPDYRKAIGWSMGGEWSSLRSSMDGSL